MRRPPLLTLLLAGAALLGAVPAAATSGVSIDVSRISVTEELAPGAEYQLPRFGVRNPGTEPTSYAIVVSYVEGQEAHQPAAAWFTFSPATLTLDAGQSRPVSTRLSLPPDAEAGEYTALIGPQIATEGSGAQVGAGAAARLTFTVSPCNGLECWLRWFGGWIGKNLWVLLVPVAVLALLAIRVLRRRFAFTIQRRPA
ncbi:MAG TPA: hypothetical protein VF013_04735 [Candidatus Limnocylindria bacterium]